MLVKFSSPSVLSIIMHILFLIWCRIKKLEVKTKPGEVLPVQPAMMLTATVPPEGIKQPLSTETQPGSYAEVSDNLQAPSISCQELPSSGSVRDQSVQTEKRETGERKVGEREREGSRRSRKHLSLSTSERSKRSPTSLKRHTPSMRINRSRGDSHTKGNHTAADRPKRPAPSRSRQVTQRSTASSSHESASRRRPPSSLQGRVKVKRSLSPSSKYSSSFMNRSHRRSHSNFDKENRRRGGDPRPCLRRQTRKRKRSPSLSTGCHGLDLRGRIRVRTKHARRVSSPPPQSIRESDRRSSNSCIGMIHDFGSCPPTPTRGELTADDYSDLNEPVDNASEDLWSAGSDYLSCPATPTGHDSIEVESISEAELRASSDEDGECEIDSVSETMRYSREGSSEVDLVSDSEGEEDWLSVSDGDWSGRNSLFENVYKEENEELETIVATEKDTALADVCLDKENNEYGDNYGVSLTVPYAESSIQEQIIGITTRVDKGHETETSPIHVATSEGAKVQEHCSEKDEDSNFIQTTNLIKSDGELTDSDVSERNVLSKEDTRESELRDDSSINLKASDEAGNQPVKQTLVVGEMTELEDSAHVKTVMDDPQHDSDKEDLEEGEISDSESEPDSLKEDFESIQEVIRGCSKVETIKLSELKTCTSTSRKDSQTREHSSESSHLPKRRPRPLEQSHRLNRNSPPRPTSRHLGSSRYPSKERTRNYSTHPGRLEQRPNRHNSRYSREKEHERHFSSSQSKRTNFRH